MAYLVETAIFAQWMHRESFPPGYAKWTNGEVDMVGLEDMLRPMWALEIKWSYRYFSQPKELKSLNKFCKENDLQHPIVTSIAMEGTIQKNGINLQLIPASSYTNTVGKTL